MLTIGPTGVDTVARASVAALDTRVDAVEPGGSVGWADLVSPITYSGVPSASAPDMLAFGPSGLREELAFAVGDYCFPHPFHVNHDVKPNGQAYLHVHWTTNGTSTATVRWELQVLRALGHDQANYGAPQTIYLEQAAAGTAWRHMVTEVTLPGDVLALTEPDELIHVTLRRVTNGGTDNANTVYALAVDLHYEVDRDHTPNKAPNFYE
jgi:hypothetical protein